MPQVKTTPGFFLVACLMLASPGLRADTILLRGGERVIGRVLVEQPDMISFKSQTLGVLEIRRDRIERIERDEPPPPPAVASTSETAPMASTTAAAETAENDSIVPAAPTAMPDQKAVTANPPVSIDPRAPAGSSSDTTPTAANSAATATPAPLAEPVITPAPIVIAPPVERVPVVEAPAPAPPVARSPPAPVTVFYPWSGLGTDQDTFDWIQLKSGEWLKGKLKGMQEYSLDFDSEKLDNRTFDWEDVTIVRSPRMNSRWFGKSNTAAGSLLVTADEGKIISTAGTTTCPRADLLAITPTGKHKRDNWSATISLD